MSLLSSSVSITRYKVDGRLEKPVLETINKSLTKYAIPEIDDNVSEKTLGWTSFENPFKPIFNGSSFIMGSHIIFSLRIDKKNIPPKVIKKYCAIELEKRLAESGRKYLSKNEKKIIKDHVINLLSLRIPSTPNIYDIIWNYEESSLWFFSNLKAANEELETLFLKSFKLPLIRIFPFTAAYFMAGLLEPELDILSKLSSTKFTE